MTMKKIKKQDLDKLIRVCKQYWRTGDTTVLKRKYPVAERLAKQSGINYDGSVFIDVIDAMARHANCNDDVFYYYHNYYKVFETLGFTIVEEIEEE